MIRCSLLLCVLLFTGIHSSPLNGETNLEREVDTLKLERRSFAQFGTMIGCLQGISELESAIRYNEYGCWCGLGGSATPKDATDNCCKVHDECYDSTKSACYPDELVYGVDYKYSTSGCGSSSASITCNPKSDYDPWKIWRSCAVAACECDKAAAECFNREKNTYNSEYLYISC